MAENSKEDGRLAELLRVQCLEFEVEKLDNKCRLYKDRIEFLEGQLRQRNEQITCLQTLILEGIEDGKK